MKRDTSRLSGALLASCALAVTGCVSLAAVEPIKNPPTNFQSDVVVHAEFLQPARVGGRCAQRGVSIFGLPAPGAMACASPSLMTLPNACDTVTGGWYAEAVCASIAHSHGWVPESPEPQGLLMQAVWAPDAAPRAVLRPEGHYRAGTAIRVEFVDAAKVGFRCAQRGAVDAGRPTLSSVACGSAAGITLANPCSVVDGGWYADLLCHEMGHVNGWPSNHPGGSFLKDGRVPGSHTLPVDEDSLVMNLRIVIETAIANERRNDPVYATTPASLADSPELARQIAEKAGIPSMPEFRLPRIEQVPEIQRAGLALPKQIAGLITGMDPARSFAGFPGRTRAVQFADAGSAATNAAADPGPAREALPAAEGTVRLALAGPVPSEAGRPALRRRASAADVLAPSPVAASMSEDVALAIMATGAPELAPTPQPDAFAHTAGLGGHLAEAYPWIEIGGIVPLLPLD